MKRILYSSLLFIGISVLFGVCYYCSFKSALLYFNRNAVEQNTELLHELLESTGENERLLRELATSKDKDALAAATTETLREKAVFIMETVNLKSGETSREQLALPGFMIGIDLKGLTVYVNGYMESMPVNEYLSGLISYDVLSFSSEKVVLRKTYDETKVENQFYICRRGDFVVVYYSDLKTVYDYTEIKIESLTEEIQQAVTQGFYVKDTQELYSILEGYTS